MVSRFTVAADARRVMDESLAPWPQPNVGATVLTGRHGHNIVAVVIMPVYVFCLPTDVVDLQRARSGPQRSSIEAGTDVPTIVALPWFLAEAQALMNGYGELCSELHLYSHDIVSCEHDHVHVIGLVQRWDILIHVSYEGTSFTARTICSEYIYQRLLL